MKHHHRPRRLILHKTTLRILGELQIARVHGGDPATAGVCVTTFDYPCPDPGFVTPQCL